MADAVTVRGIFWRVLSPRWAHAPTSGARAARHGGRFNQKGTPALYLSRSLMTAVAEYEQDLGLRPGTFCAYEVDVAGVIDLTDARTLSALGIERGDLACSWKEIVLVRGGVPPTWELARSLADDGYAGLLVPSVVDTAGTNLVLWRWNDHADRQVTVQEPHGELPTR